MSTPQPREPQLRRRSPLPGPEEELRRLAAVSLEDDLGGDFDRHLERAGLAPLTATGIEVLQVNVGKLCNQTCAHCHVDAGPDRKEVMSADTAAACLRALESSAIPTLDITGGAPELTPVFRDLVVGARGLGRRVIDRCNLTVLLTGPGEDLPAFLASNRVEVACSLPHHRKLGTDRQRGEGVFDASIEGLRRLNAAGYGRDPELPLTLVTNPVGAILPAGQASLEAEWKRELKERHDLDFDHLFTITNMPISRYLEWLEQKGLLVDYLQRLVDAFNPTAAAGVMCRTTLSVGWDGRLFDCDFNQMLDLEVVGELGHIEDFEEESLGQRQVVTARHCFGCTAGAGSSCGGQLE